MKSVFVDNLTCTTNPKKILIWTCLETESHSTQNSLLHKTGLKPIVFYGGLLKTKGTFKNKFRSPSVLLIADHLTRCDGLAYIHIQESEKTFP